MTADRSAPRRLFFALWPDDDLRRAIVERRGLIDGLARRRVPDHNLHLTLLFLGDQPAAEFDRVIAAADRIESPPFELELDRFGWFSSARVVWLGGETVAAGTALVERLAGAMHGLGLDFDQRPWSPHVTLYRRVRDRPRLPHPPPLLWPARDFALIESKSGCPYQVLRSWRLQ